jgi:hypothetical protein
MIEAQQMQDRGVKIVDMDLVLDDAVGCFTLAINYSPLGPASG